MESFYGGSISFIIREYSEFSRIIQSIGQINEEE